MTLTLPDRDDLSRGSSLRQTERGASAVEYGLLLAGVAALIVAAVFVFGGGVTTLFSDTCTKVQTARQSASCAP